MIDDNYKLSNTIIYDDISVNETSSSSTFVETQPIRVFVRIRPLNKKEINEKQPIGWNYNDNSMIEDTQNGQRIYSYDHCFGPTASNQDVYEVIGKPIVLKAMEGYNGTVFTYGQTGSGKTWTMRGSESDPGMLILSIKDILDYVDQHPHMQFTLKVSYLEVYNEEINDLLGDGVSSKNLRIVSEDVSKGVVIEKLTAEIVKTTDDFMAVLAKGEASRSYAVTQMNAESSRSHTIYRVSIESKLVDKSIDLSSDISSTLFNLNHRIGYLDLVDLAGSERQKQTNTSGKTLKEGGNINKSLLALAAIISKISDISRKTLSDKNIDKNKKEHINYRDSKLTRILKPSLGGNALTSVLITVTPAAIHREETVSALKFGQMCKAIKNIIKSNDILDDIKSIKQLKQMILDLRFQLDTQTSSDNKVIRRSNSYLSKIRSMTLDNAVIIDKSVEINRYEEENKRLKNMINELRYELNENENKLSNFEETKVAFEEYEMNKRNEFEDEKNRLDIENSKLQAEKMKLLSEHNFLQEKEIKLSNLLTTLDEKESKLKQLLDILTNQKQHLNNIIIELNNKEINIINWSNNYIDKEMSLNEKLNDINKRNSLLDSKESNNIKTENEINNKLLDINERENKLKIMLNDIINKEKVINEKEKILNNYENRLLNFQNELNIKETELNDKKDELNKYEQILIDKNNNVINKQIDNENKENILIQKENLLNNREIELNKKNLILKNNENINNDMKQLYDQKLNEVNIKSIELSNLIHENQEFNNNLKNKELSLNKYESTLHDKELIYEDLIEKEIDISYKISNFNDIESNFYNKVVSEISSKHKVEINQLESIINQQNDMITIYINDLKILKYDLSTKTNGNNLLDKENKKLNELVLNLQEELSNVKTQLTNQPVNNNPINTFDSSCIKAEITSNNTDDHSMESEMDVTLRHWNELFENSKNSNDLFDDLSDDDNPDIIQYLSNSNKKTHELSNRTNMIDIFGHLAETKELLDYLLKRNNINTSSLLSDTLLRRSSSLVHELSNFNNNIPTMSSHRLNHQLSRTESKSSIITEPVLTLAERLYTQPTNILINDSIDPLRQSVESKSDIKSSSPRPNLAPKPVRNRLKGPLIVNNKSPLSKQIKNLSDYIVEKSMRGGIPVTTVSFNNSATKRYHSPNNKNNSPMNTAITPNKS